MASKITIRDVAREAEVSVASVSRAMNGLSNVTPKTADRIRVVAERLGYIPHAGARALSMSRTNVIGVMLPDLHGEFFSELVRGMDRAARERGFYMLFSTSHAEAEAARHAMASMHGRCDGLILMLPEVAPDEIEALLPFGTAAVLINSPTIRGREALRVDNRGGARTMTRHLIATGRRDIVHIAGPARNLDARERREGFATEVRDAQLPVRIVEGDFQQSGGAAAIDDLLQRGERFDAVFAANDDMAIGALSKLKAAGLRVPQDVMVAGFDDIPLSRFLGLTTMRVPMSELGGQAVERLCDRLEGSDAAPTESCMSPELVVRETAG